jgi:hypothetical protein
MSIFFVENRQDPDDPNELPSRRHMDAAGLYWNFLGSILNGIGTGRAEVENQRILTLRRNAAAYERQRAPTPLETIVGDLADIVLAVPAIGKPVAALTKAVTWLTLALKGGPVAESEIESMALKAGIKPRTLKRAKKVAGVKSVRKGRSNWAWTLVRTKPKAVDRE